MRGIHRSPVNSPHKGQWRGALIFSLSSAWINGWVNNGEAGDLRRHGAHYAVIVMWILVSGRIHLPIHFTGARSSNDGVSWKRRTDSRTVVSAMTTRRYALIRRCDTVIYPTLAREFQGFRVWGKFVFRTLELTDTPTNLANQVKVGHALGQSRSVQLRGPERAHQNNEPSWRSSRTDRRLSRQFWDD